MKSYFLLSGLVSLFAFGLLLTGIGKRECKKEREGKIQKILWYTGLERRFHWLTAEKSYHILLGNCLFVLTLPWAFGIRRGGGLALLILGLEYACLGLLRYRENRKTSENLLHFLEFMGNYSTTTGEITWVFEQMVDFMEEPIRGGMENFIARTRLTGNVEEELTNLCNRIEHRKFREIIKNLQVGMRYVPDLKPLVETCKQSVREYESSKKEQKTMVLEAVINMALLIGMLFLGIVLMDRILPFSLTELFVSSLVGRIAIGFVGFLILLFLWQILRMER